VQQFFCVKSLKAVNAHSSNS